jgi:DNA primase
MSHLPYNWRERLPQPFRYYSTHIKKLGPAGGSGIAQGKCPLHADKGTSLSVNLNTGHWHCRHCGAGVMTVFHQRLTGMTWTDAVSDLIGVEK